MKQRFKVLIVTLNLGTNYGGILQAYALQKYLSQNHVDATTTSFPYKYSIKYTVKQYVLYIVRRVLHKFKPAINDLPLNYEQFQTQHTKRFISENIAIKDSDSLSLEKISQEFDALVVGSDQVWRSSYASVRRNLFDFAEKQDILRLSYAASFGRDDLSEYNPNLLELSSRLAKKFSAISVREDSGVDIVQQYWHFEASQHVDPTLLLDKDQYIELVLKDGAVHPSQGNLFAYVLDRNDANNQIIRKAVECLGLTEFEMIPPKTKSQYDFFANPDKYQLPPVTQWIKSFIDAKFVVTDSFHGTALSIIFNKPFIAVGNKSRGLTRFSSILKVFDLEDRLISDASQITDTLLKHKIDWKKVNAIKKSEQKRSREYFAMHFGDCMKG